jgi:site-specific DNA recombinase
MLLSQAYTPRQIRRIANDEWHYVFRPTAKTGGKPIGLSSIYRIFNNPFYAGYIVHEGEWYKGKHEPIITLEEFDRAQTILGNRGKPRSGANAYAYTSLMKCGECGCSIVAKTNCKFVKREGKTVTYVHYYCTRKSDNRPCTQTKYTRVEDLELEIDTELTKYTILPEFRDLALDILRREHRVEVKDRNQVKAMQQTKQKELQEQMDKLVDMHLSNRLDDDEYARQRNRIKQQLLRVNDDLVNTEKRIDDWLELTEKAFDFATYARVHFRNGDLSTKRDILMTLGQNLTLRDKKLSLTPSPWLVPIAEKYPAVEQEYIKRVRTNKKANSQIKEKALMSITENWRARWDLNPRHSA